MPQVREKSSPPLALSTRRRAHRAWQIWEERLETVRQDLNRQYLEVLRRAPNFRSETQPALLQTALAFVSQPRDADTLRLRQRLVYAFGLFGTSFWRRPPASLRLDVLDYAHRIESICRRGRELSRRLRLALEIIHFLHRRGPGRSSLLIRSALTDPETMRLTLLLTERQSLTRQSSEIVLRRSLQARITTCRRWPALLQSHLPAEKLTEFSASLAALTAPLDNPSDQSFSHLTAAHHQLDELIRQITFWLREATSPEI